MSILIRKLTAIEPNTIQTIITGYTSDAKYRVKRLDLETAMGFVLELVTLNPPYVKVYDPVDAESLAYYQSALEQALSFGAYDDDRLVGLSLGSERQWNQTLWINEFHIAESHRGKGLGRMLMECVMEEGKTRGLRIVGCETQNTNVPAIRFYRRMGFVLDGIDLSLYSNDDWPDGEIALFMKRPLT